MLKIMLIERDIYFKLGLKHHFEEYFHFNFNKHIEFIYEFTYDNCLIADVIIISLSSSASFNFLPSITVKSSTILIGFHSEQFSEHKLILKYKDMTLIHKKINNHLLNSVLGNLYISNHKKDRDSYINIQTKKSKHGISTKSQHIMKQIVQGDSINKIAAQESLNKKTVYTYKYEFMRHLNINKYQQLVSILSDLEYLHSFHSN